MITEMNPTWLSQPAFPRTELLGVSACGHAFVTAAAPVAAARVRLVEDTTVMGRVGKVVATGDVAYIPGTPAWSPPLC